MSKDALINTLFALPITEQQEIFALLRAKFGNDLPLSEEQLKELDARIDRFRREGSRGRPAEEVFAEIRAGLGHASHQI